MKNAICLLILLLMVLGITGCGDSTGSNTVVQSNAKKGMTPAERLAKEGK